VQAFFTHPVYGGFSMATTDAARGKHLKVLREAAGISMRELARQIGEDHSNVRYWEQSGNLPRSDVLLPMAKALGVSVEELLGEPKPRRMTTPAGKMRQLFEAASKLPRSKQEKILDILQPFVREHANGTNGNS
jgi:transcriptional regulator with XRE-family HTH domain